MGQNYLVVTKANEGWHLLIPPVLQLGKPDVLISPDFTRDKGVLCDQQHSVTSRTISLRSRMPKLRFELHDVCGGVGEGGGVDVTLQLKIQSCSNDITWNTLDEDQRWSFLQSWLPSTMFLYSQ